MKQLAYKSICLICLIFIGFVVFSPINQDSAGYNNGDILLPDYVHTDTLVVTDADYLNKCMMNPNVTTDGDIMEILLVTTIKK